MERKLTLSLSPTIDATPPLTDKQILNDTSLATVILSNGDRRLFFQDVSGSIRQAFYSPGTQQWRAEVGYVVALDARNHTPIAVIDIPDSRGNQSLNGGVSDLINPLNPRSLRRLIRLACGLLYLCQQYASL